MTHSPESLSTEVIVAALKALADPTRLELVRLLATQAKGNALCVHALAHRLGVSQPAVSQHLTVLRHLDLVFIDRTGARTHYFLNQQRLNELYAAVGQHLSVEP